MLRSILDKLRLLGPARRLKGRLFPVDDSFRPCTPHLLIAVARALRLAAQDGRAEGGDYLEFGVYRGFTLWYAQALAKDLGLRGMRFFGFDSFAGLPRPEGVDASGESQAFYEGAYQATRASVEKNLSGLGADWERVKLVEGWYDKTLTAENRRALGLKRAAVCVIDCDFYESARLALEFAAPLLGDGSIVLFDDWTAYQNDPAKGEQRAWAEFLAKNPALKAEPLLDFGGGKGFTLKAARGL
jgi:hypothetical protein